MTDEVKQALREAFPGEEGENHVKELEDELQKAEDLQEKGRMLMDVMDYLQNPPGDGDGDQDDGADYPPYPGEKGLQELWNEVIELCNDEDVDRLEEELKDKSNEDQWATLLDVRDYLLNGDEEEQKAFAEWKPTLNELESEWKQMVKLIPADEVKAVQEDWKVADQDEKKRMVWDVRKFLEQQEADAADAKGSPSKADRPPMPPTQSIEDPEMGRSEVRRRGGRRGTDYNYGYDDKDDDSGEWDDYYSKEARRSKRGRSPVLIVAGVMLLGSLTVLLTAAATADEEESVTMSAMRLLRMR